MSKAYKIKIQNFEGPFDLLFHLIERNQFNLFDIPINEITDQYMDYLFAMQEMDMEVASEFLVMAATLLHIKSRMLLPEKKEKQEEELDPREELVIRLVQYKKYKEFSKVLKQRESEWEKVFYKLPEVIAFERELDPLELNPDELKKVYEAILLRNRKKTNKGAARITQLIQHEKVSLRAKMKDVVRALFGRTFFYFSELFSLKEKSRTEVVTGFLAVLELSKLKKVTLEQKKHFSEIEIHRTQEAMTLPEEDIQAVNEY